MTANWALLAFQIFGFIAMLYLMHQMYDRLRRDARLAETRPEGPEGAQLRSGVGDLVRELRQAADEINADMAARAGTLQKLVDEANHALRRLDAAAQRATTPSRRERPAGPRSAPESKAAGDGPLSGRRVPSGWGEERDGVRAPAAAPARGGGRRGATPGPTKGPHPVALPEGEGTQPEPVRPERTSTRAGTRAVAGDGPWPGAPSGAPSVQVPPVAAGSPAAASAYRSSAASGFLSVDLADTGKFQAVRRLAEQGMSTTEIARTVGLGREEVELIMRVSEASS